MHDIYRNGKVHVAARRCPTCIFRGGNLMQLQPGRVQEMCSEADENNSAIVCHSTLGEEHQVICRGYFDRRSSAAVRLAITLEVVEEVEL